MKRTRFLPVLLLLPIAILGFGLINAGHPMEGDFSLYLRQAKSICLGDPGRVFHDMQQMLSLATDKMYSPTLYPWGFPLLIAPAYALFGINFYVFKFLQMIFILTGLLFLYRNLAKQPEFGMQAWIIAFYVGIQPMLLLFVNHVLSEPSYFCFVMISWWAVRSVDPTAVTGKKRIVRIAGLGALLIFTAQIRTEGFVLLLALGGAWLPLWLHMKHLKKGRYALFLPFVTALLLFLILNLFLPSGFLRHLDHTSGFTFDRVWSNMQFYFSNLKIFFPFEHSAAVIIFLTLGCIGIVTRIKHDLFEAVFLLCSIGLFMIWPHQNTRHILSLFPFMVYFFVRGIDLFKVVYFKKVPLSFCLMVFLALARMPVVVAAAELAGWGYFQEPSVRHGVYAVDYQALVREVEQRVAPHEHVAFAHSRMLYLSTDRLAFPKFGPVEEIKQDVDWYIYCINNENYFQYNSGQMELYKQYFKEVYRNPSYIMYKVNH